MPTLQGKYKVAHFDAKAEANALLHGRGRPDHVPAHVVLLGELHLLRLGPAERRPDGKLYALTFPMGDKRLPGIAAEDIGKAGYAIFKRGEEFIGKTVGIAGAST